MMKQFEKKLRMELIFPKYYGISIIIDKYLINGMKMNTKF